MIAAHALSKRFGRLLAVDALSFEIPRGRVVGFLGPNGAGKTTTIRMITGYLSPSSGEVRIDGVDVQQNNQQVRQWIGYLPESAPLYAEMRVIEFLVFRARIFGIPRSKRRGMVDSVVQRCGLREVRRRPIHQLSKGYRQRVGLAAALLHSPPVIILDEPTVGLDPAQIREVRALIRELAGQHTVLLSTHILPEVELTCDQVIMMARGRIRAQGTIQEIRDAAAQTSQIVAEVESDRAELVLRTLPGVTEVRGHAMEQKWRKLTVTPRDRNADLRETIAGALANNGCRVRELRRDVPSLEHLFVQMIADAEAGDAEMQTTDNHR